MARTFYEQPSGYQRIVGPSPAPSPTPSEEPWNVGDWTGSPMSSQQYYSETRSEDSTLKGRREGTPVHLISYKHFNPSIRVEKSRILTYLSKRDPGFADRMTVLINKYARAPRSSYIGSSGLDMVTLAQDEYMREMEAVG